MISNLLICRFEGALNHAKHLHSTLCRSTLNESQYLWNVEDLRKVRKEVCYWKICKFDFIVLALYDHVPNWLLLLSQFLSQSFTVSSQAMVVVGYLLQVDLLGEEVESLVTMVEKVYKVLDHHGVIPHPGVLVVKLNPML